MRKFTKIVAPALIATLGLGAVLPAQAQPMSRPQASRHADIRGEINDLNRSIDRAAARRTITQRQAVQLRRDAGDVQRLYRDYARNGLTRSETRKLENRVEAIQRSLRAERHDNHHR